MKEDCIVFVDAIDCEERAIFGDLVTKYLQLYCNARAIVTNGIMRDGHRLIKEQRPVWCSSLTPVGCHNKDVPVPENIQEQVNRRREFYNNYIMVCHDSGVALISHEWINEDFAKKLLYIEAQEDIWYFCVDTLKWSTYKTVALKKYLEETDAIPGVLLEKMKEFDL